MSIDDVTANLSIEEIDAIRSCIEDYIDNVMIDVITLARESEELAKEDIEFINKIKPLNR